MQSATGDVLQEAPEKLLRWQSHALALVVPAVAVCEGDRLVVAGDEGLVGQGGAVDVATEVVEDVLGLGDGLCEDDPAFVAGARQVQTRDCAASEVEEASSEAGSEWVHVHEEGLLSSGRREPGDAVGSEAPGRDEQMDVGMPLERASPGVQHGESADMCAEKARVGAERRERVEGSAEQHAEQRALVLAHGASQLGRQGEDDVEIWHRQKQVSLPLEPAGSGVVAAAGAGAVVAGMKQQVGLAARRALGEVSAERTGATARQRPQRSAVAEGNCGAEALEIVRAVPDDTVGNAGHRAC